MGACDLKREASDRFGVGTREGSVALEAEDDILVVEWARKVLSFYDSVTPRGRQSAWRAIAEQWEIKEVVCEMPKCCCT